MRKWVSLVAMMGLGRDQPQELLYSSLIRAHFAELLDVRTRVNSPKNSMFMMGLFSLMESIMQRPFEIIFKDIPIEGAVQDALQHGRGPLAPVMRLWRRVATISCADFTPMPGTRSIRS